MKLKITIEHGSTQRDALLVADNTATVQAVADRVRFRLLGPDAPAGPLGLVVNRGTTRERSADPQLTLSEAALRSGDTLALAVTGAGGRPDTAPVGTLNVVSGPDAGLSFPLRGGTNLIGRDRTADVRLTDPRVSKRHAKLNITDAVEIIDDGSANGIVVGGSVVDRAVLRAGVPVVLGDSTVTVTVHTLGGAVDHEGEVAFNRSPRLDPDYVGVELKAPEPPKPQGSQRFPIMSLLAPVAMAGMIYAITKNAMSLIFVAMSPMMLIGSWLENRRASKKATATAIADFRSALLDMSVQLQYASDIERSGRRAEHPSASEIEEATRDLTNMLWTRRPEHARFLQFRVGLGTQPSRNKVEMPSANNTKPELWRELVDVVERFALIDRVPVVADLRSVGNVGVAGPQRVSQVVAANVLAQLCGLHSPAEVVLAAVAGETAAEWDWLKWLPHVGSEFSPIGTGHLAANQGEANALVAALEDVLDARASNSANEGLPVLVLLVEDDAPVERSRLVQLAERGPEVGIHLVWHAPSVQRLPAACRLFLDVDADGNHVAGFVPGGVAVGDLEPEAVRPETAAALARRLAPLVDSGMRADDQSDLPRTVSFLDLAGPELATSPQAVVENWHANNSLPPKPDTPKPKRNHTLRAVVGQGTTGLLHLDLRTQGPHALVGGTTGAGKSEFLQSWVLGMAAAHSPSRVTFLLVDYKGGSAFADCKNLPHCVGLVTDLSPHLVRRALASLNAELRHRERILHAKQKKDLFELEKDNDPDTPPSLVIVVDEFAALVQEVPEFVNGVVDVAQRGRSLGLNLILATQQPSGVIKGNLRANTNLRVAVRMADEEDSNDVVGSPLAATFDPGLPGRGVVKTGPGRLAAFQSAYVGGHTTGEPPLPNIEIRDLMFGTGEPWDAPPEPPASADSGPADIERIVANIAEAARSAAVPPPRLPWLAELAATYVLEHLPTRRTDDELVFGVIDRPQDQSQPVVAFHPDENGNMAAYGTGGAGKSAFLRTIAVAAGFAPARGGPCHVYALDFGARGLSQLEALPHVGAVISADDTERTLRLMKLLRATIDERAVRYQDLSADTITKYREVSGRTDEPRILLLVDNFGAFRQAYEVSANARVYDMLEGIVADGRSVGVHLVATADQTTAFSSSFNSVIQSRLALRLTAELDLSMLNVPNDVFSASTPPGRGFMEGSEVQVAVIAGEPNLSKQNAALRQLGEAMMRAGVAPAPTIERLAERIEFQSVKQSVDGLPVFGVWDETLQPITFEPTGVFVITGPPQSGRSTTALTITRSLQTMRPSVECVLFGSRRSPLADAAKWYQFVERGEFAETATELAAALRASDEPRDVTVVFENIADAIDVGAQDEVADLLKAIRASGRFAVVCGEPTAFQQSFGFPATLKADRYGIALQPEQADGDTVFGVALPRVSRRDFPIGRGYYCRAGHAYRVQVLLPEGGAW